MRHSWSRLILGLALALLPASCAKTLDELAPFPCALDGNCPVGYACDATNTCIRPPLCGLEESVCLASCVDTQVSRDNCGSCGAACEAGASCCAGACKSLQSDPTACGECGTACESGEVCDSGACVCPNDGVNCAGTCVDVETDEANCGACGKRCFGGAACAFGECSCPRSQQECTATRTCADTRTNPENCGGCGISCAASHATASCNGACKRSCASGFLDCNGDLPDGASGDGCESAPASDPKNCGKCGTSCGETACSNGKCCATKLPDKTCEVATDCGCSEAGACDYDLGKRCGYDWNGAGGVLYTCTSSAQCQAGLVCVHNTGETLSYCRPLCASNADCSALKLPCSAVPCGGTSTTKINVCDEKPVDALSADAQASSCCVSKKPTAVCRVVGTGPIGSPCATDEECGRGASCVNGTCAQKCGKATDCSGADTSEAVWCAPVFSGGSPLPDLSVCLADCDPLHPTTTSKAFQACSGARSCHLSTSNVGHSSCYEAGSAAEGAACVDYTSCGAGLDCFGGKCVRYCDVGSACPANMPYCTGLVGIHGSKVGHCSVSPSL